MKSHFFCKKRKKIATSYGRLAKRYAPESMHSGVSKVNLRSRDIGNFILFGRCRAKYPILGILVCPHAFLR